MANRFLLASIDAVNRNGIDCNYIKVQTGAYNIETGSVTNTEVIYPVKMYKKHIKTNQYNHPTLVGKNVGMFYLANYNLTFTPSVKDKIFYNNETYLVDFYEDGMAHNQIVLFKILAIKT